jgi:regulator of sigma E protease
VAAEGQGAERKYLQFKPLWQRALIVVAGPMANFLLAIALFAGIFGTLGSPSMPFKVGSVVPGSAAASAGFRPDDRIVALDGHAVAGFDSFKQYLTLRDGVSIDFGVERGGRRLDLVATPTRGEEQTGFGGSQTRGVLGILPKQDGPWRNVRLDPVAAVGAGAARTWDVTSTTAFYLGRLLTGHIGLDQLHGFIGMARASGAITKQAIADAPRDPTSQALGVVANLVNFAALLSVSIGFMNLLPMPVLDGGHLVFYAYEWIARRPLGAKVQAAGYRLGLALLVGLMLFANLHDLPLGGVFHFFGSLFS